MQFLGSYILKHRCSRILDDKYLQLLLNYMYFGFFTFPEDLKDRFILEAICISQYNLKKKPHSKLGISSCYSLLLYQGLLSNLHEALAKSQVEDILHSTIRVIEADGNGDSVQACAFSVLNTAFIYCPKLAIDTLRTKAFLNQYLLVINKKLITLSKSLHDLTCLQMGLLNLLKFTYGATDYQWINFTHLLRVVSLLTNYLLIFKQTRDEAKESLTSTVRFNSLQKGIMELDLTNEETEDSQETAPRHFTSNSMLAEPQPDPPNHRAATDDYSGGLDDDDLDSLEASSEDNRHELWNYDVALTYLGTRVQDGLCPAGDPC